MMFNKKEFNDLCILRDKIDPEAYWDMDKAWKNIVNYICKNEYTFKEFIEYMKTEILSYEYTTLSEISDDIVLIYPSMEFIEAYKKLALKYPEETKNYQIDNFINDAENSVKYSLKEAKKKNN